MPFRILCVCTGNICRSPTAERLLRQELAQRLGAAAATFDVASAGTAALVGEPIQQHAAALLGRAGADTSDFAARLLTEQQLDQADLVLAATRRHRAECATLLPAVVPRLFTLREFARLAKAARPELVGIESVDERARKLVVAAVGQRGVVRAPRPSEDDVRDPYGGPASGYLEPFAATAAACADVAAALSGTA
ncbi:MAG TPA: low molecular weight phosphotyrosine protein phosphatase [Mycobacteriales bacterium]|nr:low molecular weight phosphotyrosine protein phosphatase [Mycobacteriales bacterium]